MDDDKDPCDWPSGDCVFSEKLRELNAENERLSAKVKQLEYELEQANRFRRPATETERDW